MCFRLLAAAGLPALPARTSDAEAALASGLPVPAGQDPLEALAKLAFSAGLDVRFAESAGVRFAEIAHGDCACSLYTGADGRERVAAFILPLLESGWRVQLLLLHDADEPDWRPGEPSALPYDRLAREGLTALPEGRVAEIIPLGP